MARARNSIPRVVIFLAGVVAGVVSRSRSDRGTHETRAEIQKLKASLADLEARLAAQNSATTERFEQVQNQLAEQGAKLAEIPSTSQIVAAMEQLLSKTMASLDDRLTAQAKSIDILKTTVSQTDGLLERVLESLDSLQSYSGSEELADSLLEKPAI